MEIIKIALVATAMVGALGKIGGNYNLKDIFCKEETREGVGRNAEIFGIKQCKY